MKLGIRNLDLASSLDRLHVPGSPNICFRRKDVHDVEVEIWGKIGYSDLTGYPIIENMSVRHMGINLISLIPEAILQEWEADLITESGVKDVPVSQER